MFVEDGNLSQVFLAPSASIRVGRFPYQIWVSRLRGLPRFILMSPSSSSLWHVYGLWATRVLRLPLRATARGVISSPTAITTVITDGASMDFPLLSEQPSRSDILFSKAFSDRRPLHRGLFPNDRCIAAIGRWSN